MKVETYKKLFLISIINKIYIQKNILEACY